LDTATAAKKIAYCAN